MLAGARPASCRWGTSGETNVTLSLATPEFGARWINGNSPPSRATAEMVLLVIHLRLLDCEMQLQESAQSKGWLWVSADDQQLRQSTAMGAKRTWADWRHGTESRTRYPRCLSAKVPSVGAPRYRERVEPLACKADALRLNILHQEAVPALISSP
jgi:hypothetical protein